jgi:hypothetical protein
MLVGLTAVYASASPSIRVLAIHEDSNLLMDTLTILPPQQLIALRVKPRFGNAGKKLTEYFRRSALWSQVRASTG